MALHPQSKAFLEALEASGAPAWPDMPLEEARQTFDQLPVFGDVLEVGKVVDCEIAGIQVRIYHPPNPSEPFAGTLVYFHGGGWVLGGLDSHDALCRRLTIAAAMPVMSVDYRRPPEAPFPAAAEDCFTVCDALTIEHRQLGLGPKLIIAGDSAGGNLAVAVSLQARLRGGPSFLGQILIYPVLDASMSTESYREFAEGYGLTAASMAWFWQQYAGDRDSSSRRNPLASPTAASDLDGLPASLVIVAEYDVLRDEGIQFARRMSDAGVPTTLEHCDGMLHGFVHFAALFDEATVVTEQIGRQCRQWINAAAST